MQKKGIFYGAAVLTLANIITRLLGFVYRIYMSNLIGAEGMGLYQLIMPVYMLVWSISSSGISTTTSRLISAEKAKHTSNIFLILNQCILITLIISLFLSITTFTFSDTISHILIKDSRTSLSLKILSFCFPFMAVASALRGYFFGLQNSNIPAISQVFEQTVRMAAIYFLSSLFIHKGLEYCCALAVIGMAAGEILSFFYVFITYLLTREHLHKKPTISRLTSLSMIITMALPLTANRVTGSFLSTVENILLPQRLQLYGLSSDDALALFGQLSAMAMPLLMFPSSLLTALSTALVPAISEALATNNTSRISHTVSKSLLFTMIIGIGTFGIFLIFPHELGKTIYSQNDMGNILFSMSFICPFLYFQVTLSGILNGLGEQMLIFKNSLLSSAISLVVIWFFIPRFGINAFIAGWLISLITISLISLRHLNKIITLSFDLRRLVIIPFISIMAAVLFSKLLYKYLFISLPSVISLFLCLFLSAAIYILWLLVLRIMSFKDILRR